MNDRERFESLFPVPKGVKWENDALGLYYFKHEGEYQPRRASSHRKKRGNQLRANAHNLAFSVWRSRRDEIAELEYKVKVLEDKINEQRN